MDAQRGNQVAPKGTMQPIRYSINITWDGCCDHLAGIAYEELHRFYAEYLAQADGLLLGRVTYEMIESGWRPSSPRQTDRLLYAERNLPGGGASVQQLATQ
ncbi:hypothetical protein SH501x_001108 [Pirellulaceae bacterium SH501]